MMLHAKLVIHALEIQRKQGTFHAAMWLRLFKFEVEEAVDVLVKRKVPKGWVS
jgi:hypothetical protein